MGDVCVLGVGGALLGVHMSGACIGSGYELGVERIGEWVGGMYWKKVVACMH